MSVYESLKMCEVMLSKDTCGSACFSLGCVLYFWFIWVQTFVQPGDHDVGIADRIDFAEFFFHPYSLLSLVPYAMNLIY